MNITDTEGSFISSTHNHTTNQSKEITFQEANPYNLESKPAQMSEINQSHITFQNKITENSPPKEPRGEVFQLGNNSFSEETESLARKRSQESLPNGGRLDALESGQFDTLIELQDIQKACQSYTRFECEGTEESQRQIISRREDHRLNEQMETEQSQIMFEQKSVQYHNQETPESFRAKELMQTAILHQTDDGSSSKISQRTIIVETTGDELQGPMRLASSKQSK